MTKKMRQMKEIPCKEKEAPTAAYSDKTDPGDVLDVYERFHNPAFTEEPKPGKPGPKLKHVTTSRKLIKKAIRTGKRKLRKKKKKNKLAEVILLEREIEKLEKQLKG